MPVYEQKMVLIPYDILFLVILVLEYFLYSAYILASLNLQQYTANLVCVCICVENKSLLSSLCSSTFCFTYVCKRQIYASGEQCRNVRRGSFEYQKYWKFLGGLQCSTYPHLIALDPVHQKHHPHF